LIYLLADFLGDPGVESPEGALLGDRERLVGEEPPPKLDKILRHLN